MGHVQLTELDLIKILQLARKLESTCQIPCSSAIYLLRGEILS